MSEMRVEALERRLEDIERVLQAAGAEIMRHEPARAGDSGRPAEADFTIKRDGRTALVALRAQTVPQPVAWIDEINAQRHRMDADAGIAVSSSGFTHSALQRAHRLGVMTRDLAALSDEEIRTWGGTIAVTLVFFEFRDMEMTITLPGPIATDDLVVTNNKGEPVSARDVLIGIVQNHIDTPEDRFVSVGGDMRGPLKVNGVAPRAMSISGRMRRRKYETEVPALSIFSRPEGAEPAKPQALVIDLSNIEIPDRCIFAFPQMESAGSAKVDVIGTENAMRSKVNIKYTLK